MKALCSPLKYHGGKAYLAEWILSLAAPHTHWVEVYGGSLAVTLAKDPEEVSEVVNDKYRQLQKFWSVLQDTRTSFRTLFVLAKRDRFSVRISDYKEVTDVQFPQE